MEPRSEQRLHPASIVFALGRTLKAFLLPGLIVLLGARSSGGAGGTFGRLPASWELWMMLLVVPSAIAAIVRYLSFRIVYEEDQLVIRSGVLFRNQRHVPYARIQNLDAVQKPLHRLLGVAEVRLETGAGKEPEATLSVLPLEAVDYMRARVLARQRAPEAADASTAAPQGDVLLHLTPRDLLLYGFYENRGFVAIGALYGLLWQLGVLSTIADLVFSSGYIARAPQRDLLRTLARGDAITALQALAVAAAAAGLLAVVRVVSMLWALVRLHDFRLQRVGDDLRTEYGLLTRVAATIPLRRIQTVTIIEGPVHRLTGRVSVRAETAGGQPGSEQNAAQREWLAPLIPRADLPRLMHHLLPEIHVEQITWAGVHPRAFRRVLARRLFVAVVLAALAAWPLRWGALVVLAVAAACSVISARGYVRMLGWSADDEVMAVRSGWLSRSMTMARTGRIQAVTLRETPFDTRHGMAGVRADTAGGSAYRLSMPYLAREVAAALHRRLAVSVATTAFRW